MEKWNRMVWMVTACGLLGSCGGDDGGAAPFQSGVDGNKSLGSLSDSEADKLCKAGEAWAENLFSDAELKSLSCKLGAFVGAAFSGAKTDAELRSTCTMLYDECQKQPAEPPSSMPEPSMCEKFPTNCTATVAELETCLSDFGTAYKSAFQSVPGCDSISASSMTSEPRETEEPASCKALEMKCPGWGGPEGPDLGI